MEYRIRMKQTSTAVEGDVQVATWVKNVKQRMIVKIASVAPVSVKVRGPTYFVDDSLLGIDMMELFSLYDN